MKIIDKVKNYIREQNMVAPGQRVVIGVSGGADSMCLLFLLYELRDELGIEISVVHIEHGIRGEASIEDAGYVEDICRKLSLPLRVEHFNIPKIAAESGESIEEAARNARYAEFEREDADRIAVAHHACDLAETMLFNLFRGSSVKGMTGISPVRGKIIRPLLCLTREEIEDFCKEKGIDYRTDASNFDTEIPRNAIRHEIIPVARRINSNAVRHMTDVAADIREWSEYIRTELDEFEKIYLSEEEGSIVLKISLFEEKPAIVASEIVRREIEKSAGRLKDISRVHVRDLMSLAGRTSGKRIDLPYGVSAVRDFDRIIFRKTQKKKDKRNQEFEVIAPENGEIMTPNGTLYTFSLDKIKNSDGFPKGKYTKWFDYDKIGCIPIVRTRRIGDYMSIKGGRKKLKDVFTEAHIASQKRGEITFLADGDHVIWLPGVRMSEDYKIDESTTRIWKVSVRSVRE